jgi:hypothetical protein
MRQSVVVGIVGVALILTIIANAIPNWSNETMFNPIVSFKVWRRAAVAQLGRRACDL